MDVIGRRRRHQSQGGRGQPVLGDRLRIQGEFFHQVFEQDRHLAAEFQFQDVLILQKAGALLSAEPQARRRQGAQILIQDPSGNVVELFQPAARSISGASELQAQA